LLFSPRGEKNKFASSIMRFNRVPHQRVEAVILDAEFDLRDLHVEVPERGTVRITGVVRENDAKDRLVQLVNGMAGVSKVEDNVAVVSLFVDCSRVNYENLEEKMRGVRQLRAGLPHGGHFHRA